MVVHTHLDARGVPVGVSLEASMPWPQVSHRRWAPHPRCECADFRRADAALDVDRSQ
jgi:hypothetical protein